MKCVLAGPHEPLRVVCGSARGRSGRSRSFGERGPVWLLCQRALLYRLRTPSGARLRRPAAAGAAARRGDAARRHQHVAAAPARRARGRGARAAGRGVHAAARRQHARGLARGRRGRRVSDDNGDVGGALDLDLRAAGIYRRGLLRLARRAVGGIARVLVGRLDRGHRAGSEIRHRLLAVWNRAGSRCSSAIVRSGGRAIFGSARRSRCCSRFRTPPGSWRTAFRS